MKTLFSILLFLAVSCTNKNDVAQTRFHDDGRAKPTVAFVPVFDRSQAALPWSLSEEMTETIKTRLGKQGNFFLAHPSAVTQSTAMLSHKDDPFGKDISWAKKAFESNEFVIFTEVVEHTVHEKEPSDSMWDKLTPSGELDMTMRIRIIDLRGDTPEVILQEMITQTHLLPKSSLESPKSEDKWKKKTYLVSPLGYAHLQMTKEVTKRLEEYILLAKSR